MSKTSSMILTAIACFMLASAPLNVYSQSSTKKPAWISKAPTVKNTYIGIANVPKRSMNPAGEQSDNSAAMQQASSIIVSQLFFNDKYKESQFILTKYLML